MKFKSDEDPRHFIYQILRTLKSNVNSGVLIHLFRSNYISNVNRH